MMHPQSFLPTILTTLLLTSSPLSVSALGINCRGSGLCGLATWDNKAPDAIMQVLRDAVWQSNKPASTTFNSGEHIICVASNQPITLTGGITQTSGDPGNPASSTGLTGTFSLGGNIAEGGICLFPQWLKDGPLTLGMIRLLADKLLEHGCGTCGSVPVHFVDQGSNSPAAGILTFNFASHPYCTGNCISAVGAGNPPVGSRNYTLGEDTMAVQKPKLKRASARFAGLWAEREEQRVKGWLGWLMG